MTFITQKQVFNGPHIEGHVLLKAASLKFLCSSSNYTTPPPPPPPPTTTTTTNNNNNNNNSGKLESSMKFKNLYGSLNSGQKTISVHFKQEKPDAECYASNRLQGIIVKIKVKNKKKYVKE